jgi:hypothetical protein
VKSYQENKTGEETFSTTQDITRKILDLTLQLAEQAQKKNPDAMTF